MFSLSEVVVKSKSGALYYCSRVRASQARLHSQKIRRKSFSWMRRRERHKERGREAMREIEETEMNGEALHQEYILQTRVHTNVHRLACIVTHSHVYYIFTLTSSSRHSSVWFSFLFKHPLFIPFHLSYTSLSM